VFYFVLLDPGKYFTPVSMYFNQDLCRLILYIVIGYHTLMCLFNKATYRPTIVSWSAALVAALTGIEEFPHSTPTKSAVCEKPLILKDSPAKVANPKGKAPHNKNKKKNE
jgi:hypothetical protein